MLSSCISVCDFSNYCLEFSLFSIYAILCNGITFEFFSFNGSSTMSTLSHPLPHHQSHRWYFQRAKCVLSQDIFQDSHSEVLKRLIITSYINASKKNFIFSICSICICKVFFYILIRLALRYIVYIPLKTHKNVLERVCLVGSRLWNLHRKCWSSL